MMARRGRITVAVAALGGLVLTGCQYATGTGTVICQDYSCATTVELTAVGIPDGAATGTVELTTAQRQYGAPIPIFALNTLVGDVTCFARVGPLATVVFAVDPARSSITYGSPPEAYSISIHDGGADHLLDGFRVDVATGDLTTCTAPTDGVDLSVPESGPGFRIWEDAATGG